MPNWTYNSLTAMGNKEEVELFDYTWKRGQRHYWHDVINPADYSYGVFISPPGCLLSRDYSSQDYPYDGYNWCCDNWGVKWDVQDVEVTRQEGNGEEDEYEINYYFDSPWCAPVKVVTEMSKIYHMLRFTHCYNDVESGLEYIDTYQAGALIDHTVENSEEQED